MTLDRLLGALPEQIDLTALRQALLRASAVDAARAWSRVTAYATFDKRVLSADQLQQVVEEAARAEHQRIDELYGALRAVLEHTARGDDTAACAQLIAIGERAEADDNPVAAIAYYKVAAQIGEGLSDRRFRMLALRRMARAHAATGDPEAAIGLFRSSYDQAVIADDVEGQIIASIGIGNMLGFQGRWNAALSQYETALALCGQGYPRLRGQLAMNLAAIHRERGELVESSAQLGIAASLWSDLTSAEHSVWFNNRGLLALAQAETESAEGIFRQALETAASDFDRAMVLDNLAELSIRQDNLSEAETHARAAEDLALRAGSPRALAEIYTRLGKIFRLRSDLNGVTFFEKALELCRGRMYPLIEANAYLEYGIFRRILGDSEEARSYFERARELCAEIGATQLERAAAEQLAQF